MNHLRVQYWVKGITPGAMKKVESLPRIHLFGFQNEKPFLEYRFKAKFAFKVDQF